MLLFAALTLVGLIGLLVADARGRRDGIVLFKPLASAGFLGVAWTAGATSSAYGAAVLGALSLCFIGDVLLISARPRAFLAGLGCFLAAHVAFCVAFVIAGQAWPGAALAGAPLLVADLLVARWLWPHVDASLRGPVAAYIATITLMVALAVGAAAHGGSAWIPVGALAFWVSDVFVAIDRFVRPAFVNRLGGLPLYYGAQLLLAWSVAAR